MGSCDHASPAVLMPHSVRCGHPDMSGSVPCGRAWNPRTDEVVSSIHSRMEPDDPGRWSNGSTETRRPARKPSHGRWDGLSRHVDASHRRAPSPLGRLRRKGAPARGLVGASRTFYVRPLMPRVGSARAACRSVGVCPKTETHSTSSECHSTVQTQRPWPRSTSTYSAGSCSGRTRTARACGFPESHLLRNGSLPTFHLFGLARRSSISICRLARTSTSRRQER